MAKRKDVDVTRMGESEAARAMEGVLKIAGLTTEGVAATHDGYLQSVAQTAHARGCREERGRIASFLERHALTMAKESAVHPAIILRIAANLVREGGDR